MMLHKRYGKHYSNQIFKERTIFRNSDINNAEDEWAEF